MTDQPEPRTRTARLFDCPHCPDGHTPPDRGSQPWCAWVSSERDGDGQPMQITVARSAGAHVAESDAQWVRERLNAPEPADRAALRQRIAEALMHWAEGNNNPKYAPMRRPETVQANAYSRADAVLAVLPAPADWAAEVEQLRTEKRELGELAARRESELIHYRKATAAPPADRAALRTRVADAIHSDLTAHKVRRDQGLLGIVPRLIDVVLGVLPKPADRAAVLREAADLLDTLPLSGVEAGVRAALTDELRRMATEEQS